MPLNRANKIHSGLGPARAVCEQDLDDRTLVAVTGALTLAIELLVG